MRLRARLHFRFVHARAHVALPVPCAPAQSCSCPTASLSSTAAVSATSATFSARASASQRGALTPRRLTLSCWRARVPVPVVRRPVLLGTNGTTFALSVAPTPSPSANGTNGTSVAPTPSPSANGTNGTTVAPSVARFAQTEQMRQQRQLRSQLATSTPPNTWRRPLGVVSIMNVPGAAAGAGGAARARPHAKPECTFVCSFPTKSSWSFSDSHGVYGFHVAPEKL